MLGGKTTTGGSLRQEGGDSLVGVQRIVPLQVNSVSNDPVGFGDTAKALRLLCTKLGVDDDSL
jgi:hypothetical protein